MATARDIAAEALDSFKRKALALAGKKFGLDEDPCFDLIAALERIVAEDPLPALAEEAAEVAEDRKVAALLNKWDPHPDAGERALQRLAAHHRPSEPNKPAPGFNTSEGEE